jgi:predicted ATPase
MYKELIIQNIKIFKNKEKLKIAPIILLYGENSSKKTTLLKTFDIIHNIFFEKYVKRGKNVSQKNNPFYRNVKLGL